MTEYTALWRKEHVALKRLKARHVRTTFRRSNVVSRDRRKDYAPCQKRAKRVGFVRISKNDGRRETFEEDLDMHFAWKVPYERHVHQRC